MNLKNINIRALERTEEFLDSILLKIAGKNHSLTARYARPSKLISVRYNGFSITGKKHLSVRQSRNNLMVISPSGGGKTTTIIYPSIFNIGNDKNGGSLIINDPSGELIKTKNFLLYRGYTVEEINFGDTSNSLYYNPLHRIQTNADVNKVASMLVRATSKESNFWTLKATELIGLCIHHLRATEPRIHQNLANVYRILEVLAGEPKIIEAYFADTTPKHLWRKFLSLMGNSENTRASIISSAQASLAFLGEDENLCDLTSVDTIDFESLRMTKTAIFLRCPLSDIQYYSTILSIFWEQYFAHVFRSLPSKNDKDVFVILEELSSLHLPNLANIISNSRKFAMPIMGVIQSENQLYHNYGMHNGKTILNNANVKVYFTGLSDESRAISDTLGEYEYDDDNGHTKRRKLMTPDEVRTMRKDHILVVPSGMQPLKCKVYPFYKQSRLVRYMALPAPEQDESLNANYSVQYLNFDKYREYDTINEQTKTQ
ncbi:type IV secretory system conjugative DNA transfer family protein [Candidatus Ulvibacter alkanivorans]|uniref:type IV secretory system conjugative DNA transfer family protein n=1 Tax=Candidatus Ulvibacter alkanivorans TaxID=2267620 RepID=UPI000DF12FA0|nr:type IV secretory system conjugative DNA transfer family protein [Candidatus Ulvibacter alkanivorans]